MKTLAYVEVRQGHKIIACGNSPITNIQSIMLDAMLDAGKVMVEWAPIREGYHIHFKHKGTTVTVRPLVDHIQNY